MTVWERMIAVFYATLTIAVILKIIERLSAYPATQWNPGVIELDCEEFTFDFNCN